MTACRREKRRVSGIIAQEKNHENISPMKRTHLVICGLLLLSSAVFFGALSMISGIEWIFGAGLFKVGVAFLVGAIIFFISAFWPK